MEEDDILSQLGVPMPQTQVSTGRPKPDIFDELGIPGPNDEFAGKSGGLDTILGMAETGYGMAMGLPVAAASGLYGLGKGAATGSLENVFRGAEEAKDFLTWEPRTATAKYNYQVLAEIMKPYEDLKRGSGELLGSVTDNPFLGGTLEGLPNIMEFALGARAGQLKMNRVKDRLDSAGKVLSPEEIQQIAFEEGLPVEDMYDKKVASFVDDTVTEVMDDGTVIGVGPARVGKMRPLVPDNTGKILHDQYNIPKGDVTFIKLSTVDDLEYMREMFNIYRGQRLAPRGSQTSRYIDPIGETLANRIEYLGNIRRARGSQLDKLIQSPRMAQTVIDIGPEMGQWVSEVMKTFNLKQRPIGGDGAYRFDFTGSVLENNPGAQKVINNVLGSLRTGEFTARDLHFLKKTIDEEINPSVSPQGSQGGAQGQIKRVFESLRGSVNGRLSETIPAYGEINGQISEIIGVLEPLVNTVGKTIDLTSPEGVKQLALAMRRISSNAKSGVTLREAMPQLIEYVEGIAPGAFKDNPLHLQKFAEILEGRFGSDVKNSIGGIMEKTQQGTAAAVAGSALEGMATGGVTAPVVVSSGLKGVKNIFRNKEKSDAEAMAVLMQYIKQLENEAKRGKYNERSRKRGQQR